MQPSFNPARDGRSRVVIENVTPEIDAGLFPVKRTCGESVTVEADIFTDGHEVISCSLLFRREEEKNWREAPMKLLVNDRWRGVFVAAEIGRYVYTLAAWVDQFKSWRRDLQKKAEVGAHTELDFLTGALWIEEAAKRAAAADQIKLAQEAKSLRANDQTLSDKLATAISDDLLGLVGRYPDRNAETR